MTKNHDYFVIKHKICPRNRQKTKTVVVLMQIHIQLLNTSFRLFSFSTISISLSSSSSDQNDTIRLFITPNSCISCPTIINFATFCVSLTSKRHSAPFARRRRSVPRPHFGHFGTEHRKLVAEVDGLAAWPTGHARRAAELDRTAAAHFEQRSSEEEVLQAVGRLWSAPGHMRAHLAAFAGV